jgi:hypothetical protein
VTKTFSARATPPIVLVFFSAHHILWLSFRFLFVNIPCNIFLKKQPVDFRTATIVEAEQICAADFSFCRTTSRAILEVFEPPTRSLTHGMDHTSARRDRPQLRDQLLRQRRTLVGGSSLLSPSTYGTFRKGRASARPLPCSNTLHLRSESLPAQLETTDQPFPCTLEF